MYNIILNNNEKHYYLKNNNFNILRLFAAIQVFFTHAIQHLEIKNIYINFIYYKFFYFFPGVPIFFTISGFLIYASYDRNKDNIRTFFKNRFLRIYPALYFCFILTILFLLFAGLESYQIFTLEFFSFVITQLTFFQFYTPSILRFWGVGTPNGSLWTICVEIQFYLCIPLIYKFLNRRIGKSYIILTLFLLSIIINLSFNGNNTFILKLYRLFIFKYLYYFLFGVIAYIYWERIYLFFVNKFFLYSITYIFYFSILGIFFGQTDIVSYTITSPAGFVANILLSVWTLAAAFTIRNIFDKIKNIDISYGIYIYITCQSLIYF
jgi:peptidoglycan/LPS O-acetylase OafA/YrhL